MDRRAAANAVQFFAALKHTKGEWAGTDFTLKPWQRWIVREIFGRKRPDGTRQYRRVYIEVPRKNGKSTLAAGLALFLLYADAEPGAEVYSAAADRDQAAIVFEQAKAMVEQNEELAGASEIYRRSIVLPSKGRVYRVLSADAPTKHGLNAHGVIFDELHAQSNRELWDVLTTATGARRQPLVVAITTAGYDRHSICWELHEYALKVRDGVIQDDSFLPVIFAADQGDDWTKESTWKKANPGYGVTVKAAYLRDECERAKEIPAAQNTFRRLHLNQWTEQAQRWIDLAAWDRNAADVPDAQLAGRPCFGALDLSSTSDISAFGLVFPLDDGRYALRLRFWLPEESARSRNPVERQWIAQGLIKTTPGNVVDYAFIRSAVMQSAGQYEVREIAYDPWNATHLVTQLQDDGAKMVEFRQGFASMSAPTKELEKLLLAGRILHGGNPVLRWMASNAAVKQDPAGNVKLDKAASGDRIDGLVVIAMGLGRATVQGTGQSIYETRGLLEVTL